MTNTAPQAKTADELVAEYLAAQRINYTAALVGETKRDGWTCDEWSIHISRHNAPPAFAPNTTGKKTAEMETRFYTGTGHREPLKRAPKAPANQRSTAYEQWAREWLKPTAPTAASVLYSLLSDAQGAEQPFDYWAADYGYDTDSRKALEIYEACCAIRRQVNTFSTPTEREQLRAMLEDY